MKILLATFGSLGDLHPYLALACELQKRGHEPIVATSEKYRPKIEGEGLNFRPVRPDLPGEDELRDLTRRVMDLKTGTQFLFSELLMPPLRESYADLLEAGADCDLLISHPVTFAAPLAAQKLGKKWLSSVLSPISFFSRFEAPVPPTLPFLDKLRVLGPLWGHVLRFSGGKITAKWVAEVAKLREVEGLPSGKHPVFEGQFSPFGTLALFSSHFAAAQKDWPPNTSVCGFCFFDKIGVPLEGQKSGFPFQNWLQNGLPPVVCTLGSSAVWDAGDFYERCAEAALNAGERALLLMGPNAATFQNPSPDVLAVSYAPFSEVFPAARLIIHQGGIGTTAQALRAGRPQLVMPYAHDQPDNAGRLSRLGVGSAFHKGDWGRLNLKKLRSTDSLRRFNRARKLGERIREENGPQRACEAIEHLASAP